MTATRDFAAFEAIAKTLYGDVLDPAELWELTKNAPDTADVHIDGSGKKKEKPAVGHKVGGLLLLGTAAEGDAAYHAGRDAVRSVRSGEKLANQARSVGRGSLQGANLLVGLAAAHELMKKPKPVPAPRAPNQPAVKVKKAPQHNKSKPYVAAKGLRTKKVVMTNPQALRLRRTLKGGSDNGVRMLAGGAALATLAIGHHVGYQRAQNRAEQDIDKAFRVKPLNAAQAPRVVSLKARRTPGAPPLVAKSVADVEPLLNSVDDVAAAATTAGRKKKPKPIKVAVTKSLTWTGEISKVDADKHQVFGWCSLSTVDGKPVVDLQGDYVPLDEIEKSAYKYVIESRKGGDMHRRVKKGLTTQFGDEPLHTSDLIESFVVTPEKLTGMGLAEDALPHGWWVGFKVNDEAQWAKVRSGERAGFSIHGTGQRRAA